MPQIIYKSKRVGRGGKIFILYKFRTLKKQTSSFAEEYLPLGRFLRKTKLDELPQILNIIKRDINIVGVRPEEQNQIDLLPEETRKILLSKRPGLTSLSSIHFFDEEKILNEGFDKNDLYWGFIKPMKIVLDVFYTQNKCFLLDVAILYLTFKKIVISFFK